MAKGNTITVSHKDIVKAAADATQIASKSIEESVKAYTNAVQTTIKTQRPKNFDDTLVVRTALGAFTVKKTPESIGANGVKSGARYVANYSLPVAILEAANDGLNVTAKPVDKKAAAPAKKAG